MKEKLKVLVVGSGGREHAICRALLQSPWIEKVYCAPGNSGMETDEIETVPLSELAFDKLKQFVKEKKLAWTFVGPEDALVAGIVDSFKQDGLKIFGPNAKAAQLEGSKEIALHFMQTYGIPTAKFAAYDNVAEALQGLKYFELPVVIKADGLAAGKGVTIAKNTVQAQKQIKEQFAGKQTKVVLEEFLEGPEYSLFVVVNNKDYRILPVAQDHKRAYDGDKGPNTGGMGAYSPVPQLNKKDYQAMLTEVVEPSVAGLRKAELDYCGILYIGLILTTSGPKVIEYNVRLGDPETQVVLPRLASDFAELIDTCLNDKKLPKVETSPKACLGVVVAAAGYPQKPLKSQLLPDLSSDKDAKITVDYANVKGKLPALHGDGGRLLTVLSEGKSITEAQSNVYRFLETQVFEDCFYRKDIGAKATGKTY
ncbi:phosphoribosylamine--glycine ligase [Liquorilactobacillus capillatus]|uniref:Phosphoribosylamine--glycine ligase n=1 Tax=Liquorilactobacillus capillatus DSM 19910 TaxID=1423731 RepID=A0A0R1M500_9LACO|nr:phosphoribosylamine--glycine ligase [Liquorilactobacillus capillatus]KRL03168.1 phosphoribosylamine-glycine ligase [Liquorilactobacillus capillatus DSM 19910]